jgi:hypothetical protein
MDLDSTYTIGEITYAHLHRKLDSNLHFDQITDFGFEFICTERKYRWLNTPAWHTLTDPTAAKAFSFACEHRSPP